MQDKTITKKQKIKFLYFWVLCELWVFSMKMLQEQEVDEELELLVLASDGLWDVVPNEVNHFSFLYFYLLPSDTL